MVRVRRQGRAGLVVLEDPEVHRILSIRGIQELLVDRNILVVPLVPLVRQPVELVEEVVVVVDNMGNNALNLRKGKV